MLVARRDPFHPGAHDTLLSEGTAAHAVGVLPRLARTMSVLQMVGTLLAVPLGIASIYSMYRANFSVETSCQNLRANIVTMLDKSVDVRTRHMLVRRDVLAFEQRCGSVDPDATAAFKALLAQDTAAVAAAPVRRIEAKPAEGARKVELRAETKTETKTEAEAEAKSEAKVETKTVQREAAVSDAAWLAAVRGALTTHAAEPVHDRRDRRDRARQTGAGGRPAHPAADCTRGPGDRASAGAVARGLACALCRRQLRLLRSCDTNRWRQSRRRFQVCSRPGTCRRPPRSRPISIIRCRRPISRSLRRWRAKPAPRRRMSPRGSAG